ncbi:hypothetical protein MMC24_001311 [Lignoscripta atroalba]|nr:hypothetical protein [Lignoscripta atroalba]
MSSTPYPQISSGKKPFTIAICGGGIGGLALAIGLLCQNIPIHIYEAAHAFAEVGAGVSFGPNSLGAMSLIDENIKKGYHKRETVNASAEKKHTWFDFRWGMDGKKGGNLGKGNEGRKAGEFIHAVKAPPTGQSSVHRAHFLDELVSLVPKECASFGKRVEEIEQLGDGVRMHFHDGSTAEASAVVGCDGVKSRTRLQVLGEAHSAAHASFTGKYAYRGLIPMGKAVELLGDDLARNSQMYLGYQGHILTFPIEKGEVMNVVAFRTTRDGKWEDEKWVLPMEKEDMRGDFEEWGDSVKKILSLMEKPDVWALFDYPPADTYYKGRICLLGDSAHASTPHQGAGAGMAMEDAFILSNLLGSVNSSADIEHAFKAFDTVRRPRTQNLVTTSRAAGQLYDFEHDGIEDDLELIRRNLDTRYKWIWEHDLEEDLKKAKEILGERIKL